MFMKTKFFLISCAIFVFLRPFLCAETYHYGYDAAGNLTTVAVEAGTPAPPPGGANPNADTDGDGISDYQEISLGTNPSVVDTDGDGLSDSQEIQAGTNPLAADTDGDGMADGWELARGLNPLSPSDGPLVDSAGISNLTYYRISTGIIGLYLFQTAGEDTSGAQNSGTFLLPAGPAYDSTRGRVMVAQGSALAAFALPRSNSLDLSQDGDFAITVWINPAVVAGTEQTIFSKGDTGLRVALGSDSKLRLYFGDSSTALLATTGAVAASQWTHVALSVSKTTGVAKLYVNGIQDGSGQVSPTPLSTAYRSVQWLIGSDNTNGCSAYFDSVRFYTKALSDSDVLAIKKVDTVVLAAPPTGLVAYYPFDSDGTDASGGNRPATLLSGAVIGTGRVGAGSLSLNGTSAYASAPALGTLLPTLTDYTVGVWVNFQNVSSTYPRIWDFGSGVNSFVMMSPRSTYTGPASFYIKKPGVSTDSVVYAPGALPQNGWHYLAVTYNATSKAAVFYQDGTSVGSGSNITQTLTGMSFTQNWIGRSQFSSDSYLKGGVDDLSIWNRTLSAPEMIRLSAGDTAPGVRAPTNLVAQATTATSVSLSWADNATDEQSFLIERKRVTEPLFTIVGTVSPNTTSFVDTTAVAAATYSYRVRSTNQYAASSPTVAPDVTTPGQ
jgi:hypothetical protein